MVLLTASTQRAKQREHARPSAHIYDDLAAYEVGVRLDRVDVALHAWLVGEHFALYLEPIPVRRKVLLVGVGLVAAEHARCDVDALSRMIVIL